MDKITATQKYINVIVEAEAEAKAIYYCSSSLFICRSKVVVILQVTEYSDWGKYCFKHSYWITVR